MLTREMKLSLIGVTFLIAVSSAVGSVVASLWQTREPSIYRVTWQGCWTEAENTGKLLISGPPRDAGASINWVMP